MKWTLKNNLAKKRTVHLQAVHVYSVHHQQQQCSQDYKDWDRHWALGGGGAGGRVVRDRGPPYPIRHRSADEQKSPATSGPSQHVYSSGPIKTYTYNNMTERRRNFVLPEREREREREKCKRSGEAWPRAERCLSQNKRNIRLKYPNALYLYIG